jgi:CheY-like chemotaxis protein
LAKVETVKLENDLALKKTFVRYISHELRTPLSIALTGLAVLEDQIKAGALIAEILPVLQDTKESCLTGVDILNGLLDIVKLDSGLTVLDASDQDPFDFFDATMGPLRTMARQKHVELTVVNTVASSTCTASIDRPKLCQVLRNLVSNAIKFTPEDGIVTVTATIEAGQFKVTVKDSGVGISAEDVLRLFSEGVQFHANAHQGGGGGGLGLWISKKIVALHGGIIGGQSEGVGLGSTFYFAIPLLKEEEHVPPCRVCVKPVSRFSVQLQSFHESELICQQGSRRSISYSNIVPIEDFPAEFPDNLSVLIVDDSTLNRKMMMNRLEKLKCIMTQADDGDVAVRTVESSMRGELPAFDVITMDNVLDVLCTAIYLLIVFCM